MKKDIYLKNNDMYVKAKRLRELAMTPNLSPEKQMQIRKEEQVIYNKQRFFKQFIQASNKIVK